MFRRRLKKSKTIVSRRNAIDGLNVEEFIGAFY